MTNAFVKREFVKEYYSIQFRHIIIIFPLFEIEIFAIFKKIAKLVEFTLYKQKILNFLVKKWQIFTRKIKYTEGKYSIILQERNLSKFHIKKKINFKKKNRLW